MIFFDKITKENFDESILQKNFKHVMFDFSDIDNLKNALVEFNLVLVDMPDQPVFDSRYQYATVGEVVEHGGNYSAGWIINDVEMTDDESLALRKSDISDRRYNFEVGGIWYNGAKIPTDRHTQQVLTSMFVLASSNPDYSVNFKTETGFVSLSADEIVFIAMLVSNHVQSAFDRERELLLRLENGELVSGEDW